MFPSIPLEYAEYIKASDLSALDEILASDSHVVEDWTSNVRILCKQCSEGLPHDHHDEDGAQVWRSERKVT